MHSSMLPVIIVLSALVVLVSYPPAHVVTFATVPELSASHRMPLPGAKMMTVPQGDGVTACDVHLGSESRERGVC